MNENVMSDRDNIIEYIKSNNDRKADNDHQHRNLMGCNENWYEPYYAISKTFTLEEIINMTEKEVDDLVKLATNIADALF